MEMFSFLDAILFVVICIGIIGSGVVGITYAIYGIIRFGEIRKKLHHLIQCKWVEWSSEKRKYLRCLCDAILAIFTILFLASIVYIIVNILNNFNFKPLFQTFWIAALPHILSFACEVFEKKYKNKR